MVFLSQKVDGNMIFTDYWKVLVLIFSVMGNTAFFEPNSWWKDDIYWLRKRSCLKLFGDGKYGLFFSQNVDGKMIYTRSFWAFHDIPGPGKYGFSRSVPSLVTIGLMIVVVIQQLNCFTWPCKITWSKDLPTLRNGTPRSLSTSC